MNIANFAAFKKHVLTSAKNASSLRDRVALECVAAAAHYLREQGETRLDWIKFHVETLAADNGGMLRIQAICLWYSDFFGVSVKVGHGKIEVSRDKKHPALKEPEKALQAGRDVPFYKHAPAEKPLTAPTVFGDTWASQLAKALAIGSITEEKAIEEAAKLLTAAKALLHGKKVETFATKYKEQHPAVEEQPEEQLAA